MASSNTKPSYIPTPFASQGQKNTIPVADQGNYLASWSLGFPPVTSEPLSEGGLPPTRLDVNGALNVLSAFVYYLQLGGFFTFDPDLASYIGGYPNGMMLWYNDGTNVYPLVSTKNNNTDNFISNPSFIGTSWVKITPTVSDFENLRIALQNYISSKVPENIGSGTRPTYTNENGVLTASSSTVGSANRPVYLNNGVLTQCSRVIGFPFPQWGSAISFTPNVNYTVPSNGWVIFDGTDPRKFYAFYVYVNDVEVLQAHTGDYAKYPIIFPVNQGQRVRISDVTFRARFIPAVYG